MCLIRDTTKELKYSETAAYKLFQPMIFWTRGEAYKVLSDRIETNGIEHGNTKAIFDASFVIQNCEIDDFPSSKKYSVKYEKLEHDFYCTFSRRLPEYMKRYKLWTDVMDENGDIWSNYGWHAFFADQIYKVIDILKEDKLSRRAVLTLFDLKYEKYVHDYPCTTNVQFYIVNKSLFTRVNMRSNDLTYGFCYDTKWWGYTVTRFVYDLLLDKYPELDFGGCIWNVANLHIYNQKTT